MPEPFVPLHEWLAREAAAPTPTLHAEPESPLPDPPEPASIHDEENDYENVMRDVRFFRAALRESLDEHVRMLAREVAVEVVARELELAPADIAGVVERACDRYNQPLSICVHPDEAQNLRGFDNVVVDESIRRGDVMLQVCGGAIDASLGMRLSRVLSAVGV